MTLFVSDIINSRSSNVTGNPAPISSLQWKRNGESIENAVASQYNVVAEDEGKIISVTQTSTSFAGTSVNTSASLGPVLPNPSGLFTQSEQGVWYDPADFNRYMQANGPELVTNGDFSNGLTGWQNIIGTGHSVVKGRLRVVRPTDNTIGRLSAPITCVIGATYSVSADVFNGTTTGTNSIGTGIAIANTFNSVVGAVVSGFPTEGERRVTFTFVATQTSHWVFLQTRPGSDIGTYCEYDNVSVKEVQAITTSTLFQDSTGTRPVTAVEQPVGLMLDKRLGLVRGAELTLDPGFDDASKWALIQPTSGSVSISEGKLFISTLDGSYCQAAIFPYAPTVVGRYYEYVITVESISGSGVAVSAGALGPVINSIGTHRGVILATAVSAIHFRRFAGSATTAVITSVSVRELPGNHAYQTTTADRPILRNRYNLLTKTEKFTDPVWGRATSNGTAWPVVTDNYATDPLGGFSASRIQLTLPGDTEWSLIRTVASLANIPIGASVTTSLWIKAANESQIGKFISLYAYNVSSASYAVGNAVSKHMLTGEWQRVQASFSFNTVSTTQEFSIGKARSVVTNGLLNAETATDFLVWGAQFTFSDQSSIPYQRVDTATVYDSDTAKFPLYLACNGTNTGMRTNSIDFTATDKVTVFAGLRKLSDAAVGMVVELSALAASPNPGVLYIVGSSTTNVYQGRTAGTQFQAINSAAYPAPHSSVLCLEGDIAADLMLLRVNKVQTSTSQDQGTGNFGNYPLYLFRRGGTGLPFNGHFYGLIIRGTLTTQAQLELTEKWMAKRTSVTLS